MPLPQRQGTPQKGHMADLTQKCFDKDYDGLWQRQQHLLSRWLSREAISSRRPL